MMKRPRDIMRALSAIVALCAALAPLGCGKSTAPEEPAASPTVIRGTVTDFFGHPVDSVAIKIQYNLPAPARSGGGPAKDSVSSFGAWVDGNTIWLGWRTESETNSYQWEIHRSYQADTGFAVIAILPAMGTTSTPHDYSYADSTVLYGSVYYYRLCLVDQFGARSYFGPIMAGPLVVYNDESPVFSPNPVIGGTQVAFSVAISSHVILQIRKNADTVRSLIDATLSAGSHMVVWNGNDDSAMPVPTGYYRAVCVVTRNDSVKSFSQPVFVNIADSTSGRVNAYSDQQGRFSCAGLPVDSAFTAFDPAGDPLGTVTVGTSVTVYACKQGYPVIARTVVLARDDTTTVNFVLR